MTKLRIEAEIITTIGIRASFLNSCPISMIAFISPKTNLNNSNSGTMPAIMTDIVPILRFHRSNVISSAIRLNEASLVSNSASIILSAMLLIADSWELFSEFGGMVMVVWGTLLICVEFADNIVRNCAIMMVAKFVPGRTGLVCDS